MKAHLIADEDEQGTQSTPFSDSDSNKFKS